MKLTGIAEIYKDMKEKDIKRCQFEFTYAKVDFDVIFNIESNPFVLMFGVKEINKYFEIEVKKGFIINAKFENDIYYALVKLFDFESNSNDKFKPIYFFEAFNNAIPREVRETNRYNPTTRAHYMKNLEKADKKYFMGWIDHKKCLSENPDYGKNVSEENLEKTKELLGEVAYIRCKNENVSSKWTDRKNEQNLEKMYRYGNI